MASPDLEWQKEMFARIVAQLTTDGLTAGVTAHALPEQALPYIEIGESRLSDHVAGHEIEATLHIWSKAEGPRECKLLQQSVRSALHAQGVITAGGFTFTSVREEYQQCFMDRDDEHWHGVQRYRVLAST